jgi:hypothetical protein
MTGPRIAQVNSGGRADGAVPNIDAISAAKSILTSAVTTPWPTMKPSLRYAEGSSSATTRTKGLPALVTMKSWPWAAWSTKRDKFDLAWLMLTVMVMEASGGMN